MTASIFLLPNATFFVELAVFLVLLFVFMKYAVPWVNEKTAERQEQIRTALEAAEQARRDAEAADVAREQLLDEARVQAREIVAGAQQTAEQLRADATGRAQAEYDRIVGSAGQDIEAARQRAVDEAARRMGEVVIDVVAKVVGREIDATAHRDLIDEAITALHDESSRAQV